MPIHAVGIEIDGAGPAALESLTWGGAPNVTFRRPDDPSATLWRRAWVDAVDHFAVQFRRVDSASRRTRGAGF